MATIEEIVREIKAEKVLDVATGRGVFLQFLKDNLGALGSAVGVDVKKYPVWTSDVFDPQRFQFVEMDATDLKYETANFDLVSISNSLHHMGHPVKVLSEMMRVLKPGGFFLFYEMYTDRQTPAQQTHTLLHQWWGRIDKACGVIHNPPYKRSELIRLLKGTGIKNWMYIDEADLSGDPLNPENLAEIDKIIDDYQTRTNDAGLKADGDQLRQRVHTIGFHSATQLFAVGRKG